MMKTALLERIDWLCLPMSTSTHELSTSSIAVHSGCLLKLCCILSCLV